MWWKRVISMAIVLVSLVCLIPASGVALGGDVLLPLYTHTASITASLTISGGSANCIGIVESKYSYTSTSVTVTLYKREIGQTAWQYVDSWRDSASGMLAACVNENKAVSGGYDYRVYVRGTISDAEGVVLERPSKYSSIVSYPSN